MNDLKNILKLLGIAAWLLASIGGVCYSVAGGHYLIAAAILALAAIAFPTVKEWFPKK